MSGGDEDEEREAPAPPQEPPETVLWGDDRTEAPGAEPAEAAAEAGQEKPAPEATPADEPAPLDSPPPVAEPAPVQVRAPSSWPLATTSAPMGRPLPPLGAPPLPDLTPIAPAKPPRRRRSLPVRILLWGIKGFVAFVLLSVLWVGIYRFVAPPVTLTMIGDAIGGHAINKQWMPLSQIDPSMARAAIGAEDSRFCSHYGFDLSAIEKAYERNEAGGHHIRGGSTISQQTAKNVFLWQGGGYFRKGLEAWFTVLIEKLWGKRRIMEVYLNVAETGIGTYGVNAGAQRYFGHDASHLTAVEAARIAAVLPLPKKREAIDPSGFTRRYGNTIAARIGTVRGDGLDGCLR